MGINYVATTSEWESPNTANNTYKATLVSYKPRPLLLPLTLFM